MNISNEDCEEISKAIQNLTKLRSLKLNLSANQMTHYGASSLRNAINTDTLESLDFNISDNQLQNLSDTQKSASKK